MANYLEPAKGRPTSSSGGAANVPGLAHSDHYRVKIYRNGTNRLAMEGNLYENFAITVGANWNNPLSFTDDILTNIGRPAFGNATQVIAEATGQTKNVLAGAKVWGGGTELSVDLPIRIDAIYDTASELMEPTKNLLKTVLPTVGGLGHLSPPGPTARDILKGGFKVGGAYSAEEWSKAMTEKFQNEAFHLRVGSFFHLFPAVIENINVNFSAVVEEGTGHPTFIEFHLSIKSYLSPTSQDIDNWIRINGARR